MLLDFIFASLVSLVALAQLRFLLVCLLAPRAQTSETQLAKSENWPVVAVQIATYREAKALPSLLDAIAKLNWPRDLLRVQIIDDSEGADFEATNAVVERFRLAGLDAEVLNRGSRSGFKAGALNHGLANANDASLIAYCDADCRFAPDFLERSVATMQDPTVAAVQSFWTYPNGNASPLAALQEAAFCYLFRFDNEPRSKLGLPCYYLGSSAVWRRDVIVSLGGYRELPFTAEDVDLSFRAAASGYRVACIPDLLAEDDALEDVLAFRAQQRRWARAVGQAVLDAIPTIIARNATISARLFECTAWLAHGSIIFIPAAALVMAFSILFSPSHPATFTETMFAILFVMSPGFLALVMSVRCYRPNDWHIRIPLLLRAGPIAAATMTSFVVGFVDLARSARAEFVVTPKQGERPMLGGLTSKWLGAHAGPLACDVAAASVLLGGAVAAIWNYNWVTAVPTAVLGLWFVGAFYQGLFAMLALRRRLGIMRGVQEVSTTPQGGR